ncbi:MAG: alanine--tRNA ligase, partial [Alphaproteobacteria bacterium]|nr:alanine--tRNA ligase [Alphaproteobacteria bacterium]
IIADHLRASSFLIADGVLPSNEGRGYVLRRIMRRGMRHAHLLGAQDPLMYRLFPTLLSMMGQAYPELKRAESLITETLKLEEERFKKTLDRGLKLLDEESANLKSGSQFPGDIAFKLYDTFGFPVDLTQDALKAKKISVDMDAFNSAMEKQKAEARKHWAGSGDAGTAKLWFEILDQSTPTEFLGYAKNSAEGQIVALVKDGKKIDAAKKGEEVMIVTNQTPFYAESGGQTGDTGIMLTAAGDTVEIRDTRKQLGKLWVHIGVVTKGEIKTGEGVEMRVDMKRRDAVQRNHSVTHLLHEALRQVLGTHVAQKGSLQDEERTRFDISHTKAISADELKQIEAIVNDEIRTNTEVITRVMPIDDARNSGAMALFGEKYDDEVRVVSMGSQAPGANKPFSVELCGGTHVKRTGDIGLFYVVGESAVSAGIRRVEALTGENALRYLESQHNMLKEAADTLKANPSDVVARVKALVEDRKKLENELSTLRRQVATGGGNSASSGPDVKDVGGVKFTGRVLAGFPAKDLKPMVDDLKKKIGSGVITLIATDDGKASIVVGVTDDLTAKISAVDLVKRGVEVLGGKGGGGRPDMAQGGGPDADEADNAVTAIEQALAS